MRKNIDPNIKDLIKGLQRWGIETIMSCEGHLDSFPYPWVTIPRSQVEKAISILAQWNYGLGKSQKIRWVIKPAHEPYILPEDINKSLDELQGGARELGRWLQTVEDPFMK